ncbi:low molecular weight phosphotyrosine protein phosphatase 1 isoform X2 [Leptinotarsa decemlineata]
MGTADEWVVDSAGIGGWHVGNSPDHRARKILRNHNVEYDGKARQIEKEDFNNFDYIFGMDEDNIADLKQYAPADSKAKILLLGDFDPEGKRIIRDPYYDSGSDGFEVCYQQCMRSCKAFLEQL